MLCKIADLLVEVPSGGGLDRRCAAYITEEKKPADITILESDYVPEDQPNLGYNDMCYIESSRRFYWALPRFDGLMLHSAAVEYQGKAYLFSGPSTVGKSTHTRLWRQLLGEEVTFLNDDKPALRRVDGTWFAYGTPWCGKDGINTNKKAVLAGICFLKQGQQNSIRRLSAKEAMIRILSQSTKRIPEPMGMARLLENIDALLAQVPVYELENTPTLEAARLSYETMGGVK